MKPLQVLIGAALVLSVACSESSSDGDSDSATRSDASDCMHHASIMQEDSVKDGGSMGEPPRFCETQTDSVSEIEESEIEESVHDEAHQDIENGGSDDDDSSISSISSNSSNSSSSSSSSNSSSSNDSDLEISNGKTNHLSNCYLRELSRAMKRRDMPKLLKMMEKFNSKFDDKVLKEIRNNILHCAIEHGNLEIVQHLLNNHANPIYEHHGETTLELAAEKGHVEIFDLLLKRGLELNVGRELIYDTFSCAVCCGHTAIVKSLLSTNIGLNTKAHMVRSLREAARSGQFDTWWLLLNVIRPDAVDPREECILYSATDFAEVNALLLKIGIDPEDITKHLECLLFGAAKIGHVQICERLLNVGVNHAAIVCGSTALHEAAENGHVRICELLLRVGAYCAISDKKTFLPLYWAAEKGHSEVCGLLLNAGARHNDRDFRGYTPLHNAALRGHAETVRLLLRFGADPNTQSDDGKTPLDVMIRALKYVIRSPYCAAYSPVILALLQDQRTAPSARKALKWSSLHYAAYTGAKDKVDALLEADGLIDARDLLGFTPLHCAVIGGHVNVVERLVQHGANHVLDVFKHCPMHYAVVNDDKDMITALLADRTDFQELTSRSKTLLHVAAAGGHCNAIRLLVSVIPVNARDARRRSPLHYAVLNGHISAITALHAAGAEVDAYDARGRTPLHYAAKLGNIAIVAVLLDNLHADVDLKDAEGMTPLCIAGIHGQFETMQYLFGRGGHMVGKYSVNARCVEVGEIPCAVQTVVQREECRISCTVLSFLVYLFMSCATLLPLLLIFDSDIFNSNTTTYRQ